eukprot:scaffold154775_cov26-Tisochrysis_lutea.AAC.2
MQPGKSAAGSESKELYALVTFLARRVLPPCVSSPWPTPAGAQRLARRRRELPCTSRGWYMRPNGWKRAQHCAGPT